MQTKRSFVAAPAPSISQNQISVDQQRMLAFKSNMKEIYDNVKRTEEVLSLMSNGARDSGATANKSPSGKKE